MTGTRDDVGSNAFGSAATGTADPDAKAVVEIRLQGVLDRRRADWFEGMALATENTGTTLLVGCVQDQSALHGLLRQVGDLGMTLLSVTVTYS